MKNKNSIFTKKGSMPGKTLAVFAGVHGNEKAGVEALKRILKEIKVEKGTVYFVFANPEAIKKNIRQINKNLNRCFLKNNKGKSVEDKRARELMKILDKCDALLDLHASNSKEATPFIICEKKAYDIAEKMNFEIISSGWNRIEPGGTDGYMFEQGKPALCLECGSVFKLNQNIKLAEKSAYQFLQFFGCIEKKVTFSRRKKRRFIKATRAVTKKTNNFSFRKKFNDFEKLKNGEIIATDGRKKYIAGKNELIIFPNAKGPVGSEAFIIGKDIEE